MDFINGTDKITGRIRSGQKIRDCTHSKRPLSVSQSRCNFTKLRVAYRIKIVTMHQNASVTSEIALDTKTRFAVATMLRFLALIILWLNAP